MCVYARVSLRSLHNSPEHQSNSHADLFQEGRIPEQESPWFEELEQLAESLPGMLADALLQPAFVLGSSTTTNGTDTPSDQFLLSPQLTQAATDLRIRTLQSFIAESIANLDSSASSSSSSQHQLPQTVFPPDHLLPQFLCASKHRLYILCVLQAVERSVHRSIARLRSTGQTARAQLFSRELLHPLRSAVSRGLQQLVQQTGKWLRRHPGFPQLLLDGSGSGRGGDEHPSVAIRAVFFPFDVLNLLPLLHGVFT